MKTRIMRSLLLILAFTAVFSENVFSEDLYTLKAGDILEISVYDEPDLKTITRISQRGEIFFPLIKNVNISGLTAAQVEDQLEKRLTEENFLKDPQVSVYIREYSKQKIYVYGSVMKPGSYDFERETPTVLKAIASAGGLNDKAFDTDIRIIRKTGDRKYQTFMVNMKDLILGVNNKFDVPLQNGDIVSVPESPPIYIFGEVEKEGIVYYQHDMRILQAVTMAGGFTEKVNRKKIMVLRLDKETKKLTMQVINFQNIIEKADRDANIKVQPYDIIIAPESWL